MTERITYAQVRRAMQTMPDLVDVIRTFEGEIRRMADEGLCPYSDRCTPKVVAFAWDKGN